MMSMLNLYEDYKRRIISDKSLNNRDRDILLQKINDILNDYTDI